MAVMSAWAAALRVTDPTMDLVATTYLWFTHGTDPARSAMPEVSWRFWQADDDTLDEKGNHR
jgi:hypothetical protein